MLVIRLNRIGKKNKPHFQIVVVEKRSAPQTGKFLELLGSYDPSQKQVVLKEDRIKHWLSCGAQPSDRVYNLLVANQIIKGKKRLKKISNKKKAQPAEESAKPEATEEEATEKEAAEEEAADKPETEQAPTEEESKPAPESVDQEQSEKPE